MAAKKTSKKPAKKAPSKRASAPAEDVPHWVGVFQEHVSTQIKALGEGLGFRLEKLESEVGRVKDAIRKHSQELHRIEKKVDTVVADHETRIAKLEGAAE
jgi:hypothetical protein